MRFVLENFGKVRSADIRVDGITVLSGPNGSGKSTVSRAMTVLQSLLQNVDGQIVIERARSIFDEIGQILSQAELPALYFSDVRTTVERCRKYIDRSYWKDRQAVLQFIFRNTRFRGYDVDNESRFADFEKKVAPLLPAIVEKADRVIDTADGEYEKFVVNKAFGCAFDAQAGTFCEPDSLSRVELSFDSQASCFVNLMRGRVTELKGLRGNRALTTVYLEPRHQLDEYAHATAFRRFRPSWNRYGFGETSDWDRILYTNPQDDALSLAQAQRQEQVDALVSEMVSLINGRIEKSDRDLVFNDLDVVQSVSLLNVASGAKSISEILRGLTNGTIPPAGLLIIDEPESNLHPEWQIRFAEFLVLLNAKFNMRVLLNTHSPYFLKAISVYADRLERGDVCSYYDMKPSGDGRMYSTHDVTDNIEEIFKAMAAPYSCLVRGESRQPDASRHD